jgi:acyl-CoA synthetase (NDP forming)
MKAQAASSRTRPRPAASPWRGRPAAAQTWAALHASEEGAQARRLDGVLVEAMSPRGLELVVGARRDPRWGPVLMVGLGGVWVEALGDVRLMAPDLSEDEIVVEIGKLKTAKLLHGFRGSPPVDIRAAAAVAAALGRVMRAQPDIVEIDVNPLMVHADGHGATALDALIVTGAGDRGRP